MKKIQVKTSGIADKTSIITKQRSHSVLLGNNVRLTYTTKKDLAYSLAEVNRRLNMIMFELNELWIFSFGEFRRIWFYMEPQSRLPHDRKFLELNQDINRAFALLPDRSHWVNGNVFSFKYLDQIIGALDEELKAMADVRRTKKQYIEYHVLQTKISFLERLNRDLKEMDIPAKYAR